MEMENPQSTDSKNYLFVILFLFALVGVGAYFVYKIPSATTDDQLSQNIESSDNIELSGNGDTLGIEVSASPNSSGSATTKMTEDLLIEDVVIGTGVEAVSGKKITVNYTGTLTDGTKFDSSLNPGRTPFEFNLGAGEVIAGWDKGFSGMKVGGKRKLTIPPSLGYGSNDLGTIPPNSTLIFDVELLNVE